jgi:Icc-related predicted phosphoesterase
MRVLTLSDEIVPLVYSLQIKDRFADVNAIFGCGDLPYYYLEYVVSMLDKPCYYVAGNHDHDEWTSAGELVTEPRGCRSVENSVVMTPGFMIAGLGGCLRYNNEDGHQYTEYQMSIRMLKLATKLWWHRAFHKRNLDVMLSHAPIAGIHDADDRPHRGVQAFLTLQRWFTPRYWVHGHVHRSYAYGVAFETYFNRTMIYNTAGYRHMTLDLIRQHPKDAHA